MITLNDIQDFNLQYLMLVQKMISDDPVSAIVRLGLSKELADKIQSMKPDEVIKLAAQDTVLCRFSITEKKVLDLFIEETRAKREAFSHAKILMAKSLEASFIE